MRAATALLAFLALSTTAGCQLFDDDAPAVPPVVDGYITGLRVLDGESAAIETVLEQLPSGTADGPAANVAAAATVVNGGSVQHTVSSEQEFSVVRIAIEEVLATPAGPDASPSPSPGPASPAPVSTGAPAKGYRQITLPAPSTHATIVITVAQALPADRFMLWTAVATAGGLQGLPAAQEIAAVDVGNGQVQVSVSWDVDSDTDLHVVDPAGEEIFYDSTSSVSGGQLDLDSNANCHIDGIRNENITWLQDAPVGTYTVRLDLFDDCGATPTNYVVTVQVAGQPTQVYTGTLAGAPDFGGLGDGIEIATFEVSAG